MKKNTVLKQLFALMLLSGMVMSAFGQDLYLPATSRSKEAKVLYTKAIDALYHVELSKIPVYAQQALDADPNFFMGYYLLTQSSDKAVSDGAVEKIIAYSGKMNKGEQVIKEYMVNKNENPDFLAAESIRQLVKLYPKCIYPKILLAYNLSFDAATKAEALAIADEIIQMTPDVGLAYNLKGYMYVSDKEYDKAREAFDRYIEMDSGYANPYDSKGDFLMATKQYDEAAKSFAKAFDIDNSFIFSKTKGEQAKWMARREVIAEEVLKAFDKMVADYNSMDVKKYLSNYVNSPELSYLSDGHLISTYDELVSVLNTNRSKFSKWHVTGEQTNVEIPDENIAVVTQKYRHDSTNVDGENKIVNGFYTSVWRKEDTGWKIVNGIDVTTNE